MGMDDMDLKLGSTNPNDGPMNVLDDDRHDAGAKFVLVSAGSWQQCSYHLITSICASAFLSLPFAMTLIGWTGGSIMLVAGAFISWYGYILLSDVLEATELKGKRYVRYRELCRDLIGTWAEWFVVASQQAVCFFAVVGSTILSGESMQFMYWIFHGTGGPELWVWITIFGVVMVVLAQMPSFHSLWFINFIAIFLCLIYTSMVFGGFCIVASATGFQTPDYTVLGGTAASLFGVFNAINLFATAYGNSLIPEIQGTMVAPIGNKMKHALIVTYVVVFLTYLPITFVGYWVFGNAANANPFYNLAPPGADQLMPKWMTFVGTFCLVAQLFAVAAIYSQPTFDVLEAAVVDMNKPQFSMRNAIPRIGFRTLYIALATFIGCLFPFIGDIGSVVGAIGYTPLDFVLPCVLHLIVFRDQTLVRKVPKYIIASVYFIFMVMGVVGAIRTIVVDATNYKAFANL